LYGLELGMTPKKSGGGGGTSGQRREAPSLDRYVASVVGEVSAEPLMNTMLAELLRTSEVSDLLGNVLPEEFLLSQIANIFWSGIVNTLILAFDKEVRESLPFVIRYQAAGIPRFDLAWFRTSMKEPEVVTMAGAILRDPEVYVQLLEVLSSEANESPREQSESWSVEERYLRFALRLLKRNSNHLKEAILDYANKQEPRVVQLPMPPIEPHASVAIQAVGVND